MYTAGKRTQPEDRPIDGTPVVDVDRGGRITWHGPGQLVGYPIIKLTAPVDVVAYVRLLEQVLMQACADLGLATQRVAGRSGVWLPADGLRPERKVAAIGVRVAKGVTMHGFALNCDPDLHGFRPYRSLRHHRRRRDLPQHRTRSDRDCADALDVVTERLRQGLDGLLVTAALEGPSAAPADDPHGRAIAPDPGVDWHLHPALSGRHAG